MHTAFRLIPVTSLLALAACTMGPNYQGPSSAGDLATGQSFVRAGDNAQAAAPAVAQWWKGFNDPVLDMLQDRALANNPGLDIAQARMQQARAALRFDKRNNMPSIGASAIYAHAQIPGIELDGGDENSPPNTIDEINLYNLGFDASWEIDLFGGQRRTVEASRAQLDASIAKISDAQVSLTADIAQSYVTLRDTQQRIALTQQIIDDQKEIVALTQQRVTHGTASSTDLEQQRQILEQREAGLYPLLAQRDACMNALAVLTGSAPGALDDALSVDAAIPLPPAVVNIGDPAGLVQRRPDIRAAERQYAAATAKIGVAEAARFPKLSFMGIIGIGGSKIDDVIDPDNLSSIAMPRLSWNFLNFGRTAARVRQAEAARDEAEAQYRQAVLNALMDTEDSLSRYGSSRLSLASAARAEASAQRSLNSIRQRYQAGTVSKIHLQGAERDYLTAQSSVSEATAQMSIGYIALQKALGLGWQSPGAD